MSLLERLAGTALKKFLLGGPNSAAINVVAGSPNGVLIGSPGDVAQDTTGNFWVKTTGANTNTGWNAVGGTAQPLQLSSLAFNGGTTFLASPTYTVGIHFVADHAAIVSRARLFWRYSGGGVDSFGVSLWGASGPPIQTVNLTANTSAEVVATFPAPTTLVNGANYWLSYYCISAGSGAASYTPYAQTGSGIVVVNPAVPMYAGAGCIYAALTSATVGSNVRPSDSFAFGAGAYFPIQPIFD
jgi:hypothetical protein